MKKHSIAGDSQKDKNKTKKSLINKSFKSNVIFYLTFWFRGGEIWNHRCWHGREDLCFYSNIKTEMKIFTKEILVFVLDYTAKKNTHSVTIA